MASDPFGDRLGRVRRRFVSTLEGKIDDADATIPQLAETAPTGAAALDEFYRGVHAIVGIGPTVGFAATGSAARDVEDMLRPAKHDRRGLTEREIVALKRRLKALRDAAVYELQNFYAAARA